MSTTLVLVDDHPVFREGVKALLDDEPDLVVVGEASSGEEAVRLVQRLRPDVVVMDLSLSGPNDGLDATRRITLDPGARVLIVTAQAMEAYLRPAMESGAGGYLLKSATEHDLVAAIRVVAHGDVYLPPGGARLLVEEFRTVRSRETRLLRELSLLEQEILALTAAGFNAREIGEKLTISQRSVEALRSQVSERLGATHRSELVRFALKAGLLSRL